MNSTKHTGTPENLKISQGKTDRNAIKVLH
jgi:hypothetical protein